MYGGGTANAFISSRAGSLHKRRRTCHYLPVTFNDVTCTPLTNPLRHFPHNRSDPPPTLVGPNLRGNRDQSLREVAQLLTLDG